MSIFIKDLHTTAISALTLVCTIHNLMQTMNNDIALIKLAVSKLLRKLFENYNLLIFFFKSLQLIWIKNILLKHAYLTQV